MNTEGYFGTTRTLSEISDSVFRWGEKLVIISVVALAWTKAHSVPLQILSIILSLAWVCGIAFWIGGYFKQPWVGFGVGIALVGMVLFFGLPYLGVLMMDLFQCRG
jgi:hypothetical protein